MDLDGYQGNNLQTLLLGEVGTDGLRELVEHGNLLLLEGFDSLLVSSFFRQSQSFGHISCPLDLASRDAKLQKQRNFLFIL